MSVEATTWGRAIRVGNPTAKAVLMALCDFADPHGMAFPSQRTLADYTEFTDRSVRAAIATLEGLGILACEERFRANGARSSDVIVLNLKSYTPRKEIPGGPGNTFLPPRKDVPGPPEGDSGLTTLEPPPEPPREPVAPCAKPRPPSDAVGTRIPVDFGARAETRLTCEQFGLRGREIDEALAEFHDFWVGLPGSKGRKTDWLATLRNSLRKSTARRPQARASPERPIHRNPYLAVLNEDRERHDERASDRRTEDRAVHPRALGRH